jgi:hypothetical protein
MRCALFYAKVEQTRALEVAVCKISVPDRALYEEQARLALLVDD